MKAIAAVAADVLVAAVIAAAILRCRSCTAWQQQQLTAAAARKGCRWHQVAGTSLLAGQLCLCCDAWNCSKEQQQQKVSRAKARAYHKASGLRINSLSMCACGVAQLRHGWNQQRMVLHYPTNAIMQGH
jgi:hypothetical protein